MYNIIFIHLVASIKCVQCTSINIYCSKTRIKPILRLCVVGQSVITRFCVYHLILYDIKILTNYMYIWSPLNK